MKYSQTMSTVTLNFFENLELKNNRTCMKYLHGENKGFEVGYKLRENFESILDGMGKNIYFHVKCRACMVKNMLFKSYYTQSVT